MHNQLECIAALVKEKPVTFRGFSSDTQQINPISRVMSISQILERITLPKKSTILDIGTGYGYGAVLLNALGYKAIGVEVNGAKLDEGMKYWRDLGIEFSEVNSASAACQDGGLYFLKRDSRNLDDFFDGSIDMASAFYIGWDMITRDGAFRSVGRVLKPQGNFAVTTEGPMRMSHILRKPIVTFASRIAVPRGLEFSETFDIENADVYDKYVVVYEKPGKKN